MGVCLLSFLYFLCENCNKYTIWTILSRNNSVASNHKVFETGNNLSGNEFNDASVQNYIIVPKQVNM